MGIGTSDFGASQVDAATQGGPSSLEMSSFLQDLSLGAISSPVARAPVSVLSPSFQRFLDRESAILSPSPPVRVTVEAGVSAVVTPVYVAVDACVAVVDQSVQAVVGTGETSTDYDPPVEPLSAAPSPPASSVPETVEADVEQSDVPSTDSTDTLLEAVESRMSLLVILCPLSLLQKVLFTVWFLRLLRCLPWDPVSWIPTTSPLRLACQVT